MTVRTLQKSIIYFSLASIAAVAVLLVVDLHREHARGLAALERQLKTEAQLVVQQTDMALRTIDLFLDEIADEVKSGGLQALVEDRDYRRKLVDALAYAPQIASLALIDHTGRARLSSTRPLEGETIDLSARSYFQAHREGTAYLINPPVTSRSTGREVVPVSMRIENAQEDFLGVVAAGLDLEYLSDFYRQILQRQDLRIMVFLSDGTLMSFHSGQPANTPANLPERVDPEILASASTWVGPSPLDSRRSVITTLPSERYPLRIAVASDYGKFLAQFYATAWLHLFTFALVTIALVAGTTVLVRSISKAHEEQEEKFRLLRSQRQSERLSHTIIRNLPNGRAALLDRNLRYVFADGSEFEHHPVLSPAAVQGKTFRDVLPPDCADILERLAREALAGIKTQGEISHEHRVYEVTAVPLESEKGQIDQLLLLTQDITEIRATMTELEARNRELREISFTDPLLEIANRRAFDQGIAREWRRAIRKQEPLSLLMIDVDHFKLYNDEYGHAEGDRCLQEVAAALGSAVKRPGDVLARYGGEEFAVLLPETELAGAASVAERIHKQLFERNLCFPQSPTARRVTVSIGLAAMRPSGDHELVHLIEGADDALYAAKEEGRNRTVIYETPAHEAQFLHSDR